MADRHVERLNLSSRSSGGKLVYYPLLGRKLCCVVVGMLPIYLLHDGIGPGLAGRRRGGRAQFINRVDLSLHSLRIGNADFLGMSLERRRTFPALHLVIGEPDAIR